MAENNLLSVLILIIIIGVAFFMFKDKILLTDVESVTLTQSQVDFLNNEFIKANSEREIGFCLNGKVENNNLIIEEILIPKETLTIGDSFIAIKCSLTAEAIIHSHPNGDCSLSLRDAYTFGITRGVTDGIICGVNDIAFYSSNDLENSVEVNVV